MLSSLRWVTRKATTKAQKLPKDWEAQVDQMNIRIGYLAAKYNIDKRLVFSMDETYSLFVPMGGTTTFAVKGARDVPVQGLDEKAGCTMVMTCTPAGELLPLLVIVQGKTVVSLPDANLRHQAELEGHVFTMTPSHWMTVDTMKMWVVKIIFPRYKAVCMELKKDFTGAKAQRSILQFDLYTVHVSKDFLSWLHANYPMFNIVLVPAGCTGVAQIPDLVLNRPFKHAMKMEFAKEAAMTVSSTHAQQPCCSCLVAVVVHDPCFWILRSVVVQPCLLLYVHRCISRTLTNLGCIC